MPYSEWINNTGSMPEALTKYAMIEVMYRDGLTVLDAKFDREEYWRIERDECDVIKYRYIYEEDELDGTYS